MMTTIFIVLASIVIYIIGIFSPTKAKQIQRKTNKIASRLKDGSDRFYNPFTFVAQSTIELIRKIFFGAAGWGPKTRNIFRKNKKTSRKR